MRPLLTFVVLAVAACAPASRSLVAQTADRPTAASLQEEISRAKVLLDSALRGGDIASARALLSDDVQLTVPSGETFSGRSEAVNWLRINFAHAPVSRVTINPRRTDFCVDGAIERQGEYVVAYVGARDPLSGSYTLRWSLQPDGSLVVSELVTGPSAESRSRLGRCRTLQQERFAEQRTTVMIALPFGAYDMESSFTSNMRGAQYESGRLSAELVVLPNYQGTRSTTPSFAPVLGIRHRFTDNLYAEATGAPVAHSGVVEGYNPTTLSHLKLDYRIRSASLQAGYQFGATRVGAGPILTFGSWALREHEVERRTDGPRPVHEFRRETFNESWTDTQVGVAFSAGHSLPISLRASITGYATYRTGLEAGIPATEHFGPSRVSLGGYAGGVGVEYRF